MTKCVLKLFDTFDQIPKFFFLFVFLTLASFVMLHRALEAPQKGLPRWC